MRQSKKTLKNDDQYVIDELWAMDVMGMEPAYDDCDGDCAMCPHNLGEFDDYSCDYDDCDEENEENSYDDSVEEK